MRYAVFCLEEYLRALRGSRYARAGLACQVTGVRGGEEECQNVKVNVRSNFKIYAHQ